MEKVDLTELYTQRLLIFLEVGPQANKYRQMMLDPIQFKRVSDTLSDVMPGTGEIMNVGDRTIEIKNYKLSDEIYKLPDTLRDIQYLKVR